MHGASLPVPVSPRASNLWEPNSASSISCQIETRDRSTFHPEFHDKSKPRQKATGCSVRPLTTTCAPSVVTSGAWRWQGPSL